MEKNKKKDSNSNNELTIPIGSIVIGQGKYFKQHEDFGTITFVKTPCGSVLFIPH